jgi:RNA polymerase sigma factor (TIGR02999 family)
MSPSVRADGQGPREVDELFAVVYASLKGLAHKVRAGRGTETLNTTALVHEAYIRLATSSAQAWKNEAHFFAVAARAMRQILVDAARREMALKRGGDRPESVTFDESSHTLPARPEELVALDAALDELAIIDPRRAQVIEHRIFAGLSTDECARLLGISTATVERDWRAARAWLAVEIAGRNGSRTEGERGG